MNLPDDPVFLTWPRGPVLRLTRTTLRLKLPRREEEPLLRSVPAWARHPWLVRNVWLRQLYGPHFLDEVSLRLDGLILTFRTARGRERSWRVPPEDTGAVEQFIEELDRRRARRESHRVTGGRGRSLLPVVALIVLLLWFIRRRREE